MNKPQPFDIIIVGGGMVGATLACALGNSPLQIAIIEGHLPGEVSDDWDLRVSSISIAGSRIFNAIGAWRGMLRRRISPFRQMQVWDGHHEIGFDSADLGQPRLGHIIENRVVQAALLERIGDFSNLSLIHPGRLQRLQADGDSTLLTLANGRQLRATLVIGADGANSTVRTLSGIPHTERSYGQKGLVCAVRCAEPNPETAFQHFLRGGPLAFLPLKDGQSSIVWSAPTEQADELLEMDPDSFATELEQAFEARLGRVEHCSQRAAFPLIRRHAEHYVQPGLALIGDAAHTIHPLAGQGVNLGLLDAASLAQVLLDGHQRGRSPADIAVLRRYERWRRGENSLMQNAMDGFDRLFRAPSPLIGALRRSGIDLSNRIAPVKHLFATHAMGLGGDLPEIARKPIQPGNFMNSC